MVGYAYSYDHQSGYSCILIKAYDCEDLSFINALTPTQTYRVHRKNSKAELISQYSSGNLMHLNLSHIKEILSLITLAEYDNNYPVILSWAVTPSGNLLKKQIVDLYSVWPIPPFLIESEDIYINITGLFFKSRPSILELSFTANVINSVAFLCGINSSDLFAVCGGALYCSSDFAGCELSLYKSRKLYSFAQNAFTVKNRKYKIKAKQIFANAENLSFPPGNYGKDVSEWIANIKRECVSDIINIVAVSLKKGKSFSWLLRRVKHIIFKSLDNLISLGTELISQSTAGSSSDIKVLSFNELLEAFTFADSMRDITKNIRTNKLRRSAINKLESPQCIYKGKFYYKEK